MTIEEIIYIIMQQLGGKKFVLETEAKFGYGLNESFEPYLNCIFPKELYTKNNSNRFTIAYNYIYDLYHLTFAYQEKASIKVINTLRNIKAEDLISVFEKETGIICAPASLVD